MLQKRSAILLAMVLSTLPCSGLAGQERPIKAADVPREFTGTVEWQDGSGIGWDLVLKIDKIEEKDGSIRFSGSHHYSPTGGKMKIQGTIDSKTGQMYFREFEPTNPGAEIDGAFQGTISRDMQLIEAVWINNSDGRIAYLKTKAAKMK